MWPGCTPTRSGHVANAGNAPVSRYIGDNTHLPGSDRLRRDHRAKASDYRPSGRHRAWDGKPRRANRTHALSGQADTEALPRPARRPRFAAAVRRYLARRQGVVLSRPASVEEVSEPTVQAGEYHQRVSQPDMAEQPDLESPLQRGLEVQIITAADERKELLARFEFGL